MYLAVKDTNTTQISASGSFPLGECYDSARPSEDEAGKAHRSLRQVSSIFNLDCCTFKLPQVPHLNNHKHILYINIYIYIYIYICERMERCAQAPF